MIDVNDPDRRAVPVGVQGCQEPAGAPVDRDSRRVPLRHRAGATATGFGANCEDGSSITTLRASGRTTPRQTGPVVDGASAGPGPIRLARWEVRCYDDARRPGDRPGPVASEKSVGPGMVEPPR